jgi:hypothetical protein
LFIKIWTLPIIKESDLQCKLFLPKGGVIVMLHKFFPIFLVILKKFKKSIDKLQRVVYNLSYGELPAVGEKMQEGMAIHGKREAEKDGDD